MKTYSYRSVRSEMYNLPNARLAVLQAVLMAVGSWVFSLWLIGLPFLYSRFYFFGGLAVSSLLCLSTIIVSIPLICPKCGKNLAFTSKPSAFLADWKATKQQYFPSQAVRQKRAKCPHCEAEISLRSSPVGPQGPS